MYGTFSCQDQSKLIMWNASLKPSIAEFAKFASC